MSQPPDFLNLITLYNNTTFDTAGDEGWLSIASKTVLDDLGAIEAQDELSGDYNFEVIDENPERQIGLRLRVRASAPRVGLGILVNSLSELLLTQGAFISEPKSYFVKEGKLSRQAFPPPEILLKYRKIIEFLRVLKEASALVDDPKQTLIFFRDEKIELPVRYDFEAVNKFSLDDACLLLGAFDDKLHRAQKLTILADAVIDIIKSQPINQRFKYLILNIDSLVDDVQSGYRLFASSFSYSKIRSDIEKEKFEFIGKIHKTVVDVQSQLLAIPVATAIAVSQLKATSGCDAQMWTNIAVLMGAWLFVILIVFAIINQWLTLSSIFSEVGRQKIMLQAEAKLLNSQFIDIFVSLSSRIKWHRFVLICVGLLAILGASFTTFAFWRLTAVEIGRCVFS